MPHLPNGIIVERTPMRDLARRLVEVLYEARVPAWMAPRAGLEVGTGGTCVLATAWDVTVSDGEADRARGIIAEARSRRAFRLPDRSRAARMARITAAI